jgi:hypothetical protein
MYFLTKTEDNCHVTQPSGFTELRLCDCILRFATSSWALEMLVAALGG